MRRVIGLAATLLSVLLLAALALVAVLSWVSLDLDLTPYKARVVAEMSARSGLRVDVTGALTVRLGPELRLSADGLTITNPAAGPRPLIRAQRATLTAATLPLLRGRLEPKALDLTGAHLDLTRNRAGRANWELPLPANAKDNAAALLDGLRLRVHSSRVIYQDPGAGRRVSVGIRALEARRSADRLDFALDANLDGEPVRLTGHTAPLAQLLARNGPLPLDLRGQFLGLDLRAEGTLARPDSVAQSNATVTLKARSLRGLSPWLGQDVAALGPVDARLVLKGGGGRYALAPLEMRIGSTRADGRATLDLQARRPALDLELTVAELDLRPYLPEAGKEAGPDPGPVFSAEPLNLGWMAAVDVQTRVHVSDLIAGRLSPTDLVMTATLADGRLNLAGTGKAEGGRTLNLDLVLDTKGTVPTLAVDLRGDKLLIAPLLAGTGAEGQIRGDLDARASLKADGPSEAAMAASLSGDLMLMVEGAEAQVQDLDRLAGGTRTILGQILTPRSSMARIDCGLAVLSFKDGQTPIRGVIDTPNSTVTGEGRLDLARESIELRLVPQAKGVTLAVAAPVLVSGPLANPDYRIEPGGLLASLSQIAARIAVPQLLLVDALGQAAAGSPCGRILAGEVPDAGGGGPLRAVGDATGTVLQAPGTLTKGVGGVAKQTGEAVKDAGGAVLEGTRGLLKGVGGLIKGAAQGVEGAVKPESAPESAPESEP